MAAETANSVLEMARSMLIRPDEVTAGLWPRAAALLGRQAIEMALDELWVRRSLGVERCSTHAQLLCLPVFLPGQLAESTSWAWIELTRGCHQHIYELAPTAEELSSMLASVSEVIDAIGD